MSRVEVNSRYHTLSISCYSSASRGSWPLPYVLVSALHVSFWYENDSDGITMRWTTIDLSGAAYQAFFLFLPMIAVFPGKFAATFTRKLCGKIWIAPRLTWNIRSRQHIDPCECRLAARSNAAFTTYDVCWTITFYTHLPRHNGTHPILLIGGTWTHWLYIFAMIFYLTRIARYEAISYQLYLRYFRSSH